MKQNFVYLALLAMLYCCHLYSQGSIINFGNTDRNNNHFLYTPAKYRGSTTKVKPHSAEFTKRIALDKYNNIYCVLKCQDTQLIGNTIIPCNDPNGEWLLLKMAFNGKVLWYKKMNSSGEDELTGILLDKNRDIYMIGYLGGMLNNSIKTFIDFKDNTSSKVNTIKNDSGNVILIKASHKGDYINHKYLAKKNVFPVSLSVIKNQLYIALKARDSYVTFDTFASCRKPNLWNSMMLYSVNKNTYKRNYKHDIRSDEEFRISNISTTYDNFISIFGSCNDVLYRNNIKSSSKSPYTISSFSFSLDSLGYMTYPGSFSKESNKEVLYNGLVDPLGNQFIIGKGYEYYEPIQYSGAFSFYNIFHSMILRQNPGSKKVDKYLKFGTHVPRYSNISKEKPQFFANDFQYDSSTKLYYMTGSHLGDFYLGKKGFFVDTNDFAGYSLAMDSNFNVKWGYQWGANDKNKLSDSGYYIIPSKRYTYFVGHLASKGVVGTDTFTPTKYAQSFIGVHTDCPEKKEKLTLQGKSVYCGTDSGAVYLPSTTGAKYIWMRNGFETLDNLSDTLIKPQDTGYHWCLIQYQDGCMGTSDSIYMRPYPLADTSKMTIKKPLALCQGKDTVLVEIPTLLSNKYQWYKDGNILMGDTFPTKKITQNGIYKVIASNTKRCSITSKDINIVFTLSPQKPSILSATNHLCAGDSIKVSVNNPISGFSYSWYDANKKTSVISNQFMIKDSGLYSLFAVNNGCYSISKDTFVIKNPLPKSGIRGENNRTKYCTGDSLRVEDSLYGASGNTYQWYLSGNLLKGQTSFSFFVKTKGLYQANVTSIYGCKKISSYIQVDEAPLPSKPKITQKTDSLLSSFTGRSDWYDSSGKVLLSTNSSYYIPKNIGFYRLKVMNSNGCVNISDPYFYNWTGLDEIRKEKSVITIYPNPSLTGQFNLTGANNGGQLLINDLQGKVLFNQQLLSSQSQIINTILLKGIYLIEVKTSEGVKNIKWIIE